MQYFPTTSPDSGIEKPDWGIKNHNIWGKMILGQLFYSIADQ